MVDVLDVNSGKELFVVVGGGKTVLQLSTKSSASDDWTE